MSDRIVDLGGTTMMSETIEFVGAEHILAKRGATPEIHDQIIRICEDYEKHLAGVGQDCRTGQPTTGNKAGGLSTIEEKSHGRIPELPGKPGTLFHLTVDLRAELPEFSNDPFALQALCFRRIAVNAECLCESLRLGLYLSHEIRRFFGLV